MGCGVSKPSVISNHFSIVLGSAEKVFGRATNLVPGEFELPNGETLQFVRFGHYMGRKVFYFHDSLSSRLESLWIQREFLENERIEIVAINRPGVGQTKVWDSLTYASFAEQMSHLFKRLYIKTCHLLAVGSGAPWAYATAVANPNEVLGVVVVSGIGPVGHPNLPAGALRLEQRTLYKFVDSKQWFLRYMIANVRTNLHRYLGTYPPATLKLVAEGLGLKEASQPNFMTKIVPHAANCLAEALIQDLEFCQFREARLEKADWNIDFKQIKAPVLFYHGSEDERVPVEMVEFLAKEIPSTRRLVIIEGISHNALFVNRGEDVLADAFKVFDNEFMHSKYLPPMKVRHGRGSARSSVKESNEEPPQQTRPVGEKDYDAVVKRRPRRKRKSSAEGSGSLSRENLSVPISEAERSGSGSSNRSNREALRAQRRASRARARSRDGKVGETPSQERRRVRRVKDVEQNGTRVLALSVGEGISSDGDENAENTSEAQSFRPLSSVPLQSSQSVAVNGPTLWKGADNIVEDEADVLSVSSEAIDPPNSPVGRDPTSVKQQGRGVTGDNAASRESKNTPAREAAVTGKARKEQWPKKNAKKALADEESSASTPQLRGTIVSQPSNKDLADMERGRSRTSSPSPTSMDESGQVATTVYKESSSSSSKAVAIDPMVDSALTVKIDSHAQGELVQSLRGSMNSLSLPPIASSPASSTHSFSENRSGSHGSIQEMKLRRKSRKGKRATAKVSPEAGSIAIA